MPLKLDMHVHTHYSNDAHITPKELVFYAKERGLDGVAITDHDTVSGLAAFSKIRGLLIIPGVEVSTSQGHVLAINVNENLQAGQSFAATVDQIHAAGGLAIIAHPTAFLKGVSGRTIGRVFDAVEVVNASAVPFAYSVRKNLAVAAQLGLPQTGGSDAHCAREVGMAYSVVDAEKNVDRVVEAIRTGAVTPFGRSITWGMRLEREFLRVRRKLG